jgi:two-component system, chemotaxis family, chemotaxis protein CheY
MKALVVDDSNAVRDALAQHLTELGFQVEQAANGFEALAKAATIGGLAVMLLDWTMPGMDGLELLRRLRADVRYDTVPMLVLAGDGELSFVAEAIEAGASECLVKPFDAQTLLEKLLLLGVDPEQRRVA